MTIKYFVYPFGTAGDLASIPDPTQPSGVISYQQGFGPDYQLIQTDPASLNIPRDQFNQLMNDITGAIQQIQQNGIPFFITTAMNDGSPFSYVKNAVVFQPSDGNIYQSLVNSNTDVPPSVKWQIFGSSTSLYLNYSVDTGGANHYAVAPSPAILAYANGDIVPLKPAFANTGACDLAVNGLSAIPIKTMLNQDPTTGMIIPTGSYLLLYSGGKFILMNPTLGSAAYQNNTGINSAAHLKITNDAGTPTTKATITCDQALLNTSTASLLVSTVSLTVNMGTTGANALDTGSLAASSEYHLFIISNGTTTAGLASLSPTSPTMPAGYTYKMRVGCMLTGVAATLLRTIQRGSIVKYQVVTSSTTPNIPKIASGTAGSYLTPTWIALTVQGATGSGAASFIPSTAGRILGVAFAYPGFDIIVAPNNAYGPQVLSSAFTNPPPVVGYAFGGDGLTGQNFDFTLESTSIYWASSGTNNSLWCLGWIDSVNAS